MAAITDESVASTSQSNVSEFEYVLALRILLFPSVKSFFHDTYS